jgi:excisionase family DNA binding protein
MPKETQPSAVGTEPGAEKKLNLMTMLEAAAYARVSISTVRRWVRDEELAVYQAGRQKRVDETDLVRFLSGTKSSLFSPPI